MFASGSVIVHQSLTAGDRKTLRRFFGEPGASVTGCFLPWWHRRPACASHYRSRPKGGADTEPILVTPLAALGPPLPKHRRDACATETKSDPSLTLPARQNPSAFPMV